MKQSKFLSLNWRDLLHAFVVGLLAFVINFLQVTLVPSLNVSPEIKTFLVMALAYLSKKFFQKPSINAGEIGLPKPR